MVEISSCRRIESISGVKTSRKEQRNNLTNFLDIDKPIDEGNVLERPLHRRENISGERFNSIIRMCLEPRNSGDLISLSSPKNFVVQYFTVSRNHPVKICGRPQCPLAAKDGVRTKGKKQQPTCSEVVEKTENSRSSSSQDLANELRDFPVELTVTPRNIKGVKGHQTPCDNSEQSHRRSTLGVVSRCSSKTYSIASSKSSKRNALQQTNPEECWHTRCSKFIINLPVTLSDRIFGPRVSKDEKQNIRNDRPSSNRNQNTKVTKKPHSKHQENKKSGNSGGGSFRDRGCHKKTGTDISRIEKANQVDPCHLRTSKSVPEAATCGKPVSVAKRNNVRGGKKITSGCSDGLERPDNHSKPRTRHESPKSSERPRRKTHRGKYNSPSFSNWSAILSDKFFGPRKRRAVKNGENKLARRKLTTVRNAENRNQSESEPKSNGKKGRLMLKKYTISNGPEAVEETLCFDVLADQRSEQKLEERICQKIPQKLETIEERNIAVDNFSDNTWQPRKSKGCGQSEDKVCRSRSSSKRSTRRIEKTTSTEHIFLTNLIAKLLNRHVVRGGQYNGKDKCQRLYNGKRKIDSRYRREEKCSNIKRSGDDVSRKYATTSIHKHGKRSSMSQKNLHGRKTIEDSAGNDEDSHRKKITRISSMTDTEFRRKEKSKGVKCEGSGSSVKVKVLRAIDKNYERKRYGETCSPCLRSEEKIETRGNEFHSGRKGLESQSEFEELNRETGGQKDVTFSRANTCERLIVKANVISEPTMDPDTRCVGRTFLIAGQNIRVKMLDDRKTSTTGLSEESGPKHDRQKRKMSSTSSKKTETKCVRVTGTPEHCLGGRNLVSENDSKSLLRRQKNATRISVGFRGCVRKTESNDTNVCWSNNPEGIQRGEDLPKSRLDREKLCSLVGPEISEGCEKAVFDDETKFKESDEWASGMRKNFDITGGKREPCGGPGCKNGRASRSGELLKLYPRTSSAEKLHRGVSKVEIDSSANTGNWIKSSGKDLDVTKPESRNIINFYYSPGSNEAAASRRELQTNENGKVKKVDEKSNTKERKPLQRIENPRQVCRANLTLNNDDMSANASLCRKGNSDEDKNDGHSTRERNVSNNGTKNDLHQKFGIENSNLQFTDHDVNRVSPEPLIPAIKSPKKSDQYPTTGNKQPFLLSSSNVAKRFAGKSREKNGNGGPRNADKKSAIKDGGKKAERESDPNPLTKSSENISDGENSKARTLLHTETSKVEDPETLSSGKIVKGSSEITKACESRKSSKSPSLQRSAGLTEKDESLSRGVREDRKVDENKRKKSAISEKTTAGEALISRSGGNRGVTRTADLSSERLMNGKNLRPSFRPEENLNYHRTSTSKDEEPPSIDKPGIPKPSKIGKTSPKRSNAAASKIGKQQKTEKFADSGTNQVSVDKGERNSRDSGSMRSRVTEDSSNIKSGRIPELISRRSMNFKNTRDCYSNNARAESPRKNSLTDCNLENANPPSGGNSSAIYKSDIKDPSRRRVPCNFQAHTNDGSRNGTLTSQCSRVSPDSHKIIEKPQNNESEEDPNANSDSPGCLRSKRDSKTFEESTVSSNYSSNEREREIMQHEYENVPEKIASFSGAKNQKNESSTSGCCLVDDFKQFLHQGQTFSTAKCKRQPSGKKIFCPENGGQNVESEFHKKSERTRGTSEVCKKIAVDQNEKNIPKIYKGSQNRVDSMSSIEKAYNRLKTILNKTKNFHKGLLCGRQTKETQFYGAKSEKNVKSKTSKSSGSLSVSISFGSSIFANLNTPTYSRKEKNCTKH